MLDQMQKYLCGLNSLKRNNDGKPICYDDQSLWEEIERCRLENKEEYSLPYKLSDEERDQIINMIAKGM